MNFRSNIENFLYDKLYFISMFENKLHIYSFNKVIKLNKSNIILEFDNFILNIKGDKLEFKKLLKNEMLLSGKVLSLNIEYNE